MKKLDVVTYRNKKGYVTQVFDNYVEFRTTESLIICKKSDVQVIGHLDKKPIPKKPKIERGFNNSIKKDVVEPDAIDKDVKKRKTGRKKKPRVPVTQIRMILSENKISYAKLGRALGVCAGSVNKYLNHDKEGCTIDMYNKMLEGINKLLKEQKVHE